MKKDKKSGYFPGPVVLFGSGETSSSGRKVFDKVLAQMASSAPAMHSPRIALLETPAGFELNSAQVIQNVADFIARHVQNYHPQTTVVAARKRGTAFSPDDPEIVRPLLQGDLIFMGPGSPSYAVRQLRDSLAWHYLVARHRLGAALVLASAAVIAAGVQALPVYEIYKVGEDLHWKPGLNFFGAYGLPLVIVPHWNNSDGGENLDTSRCFMGQSRFAELLARLPAEQTVLGIDEKTAVIIDFAAGIAEVQGQGGITLLQTTPAGDMPQPEKRFGHGECFSLAEHLPLQAPEPSAGLPEAVWHAAQHVVAQSQAGDHEPAARPSQAVLDLVAERQAARRQKDWPAADRLRKEISDLGWVVNDGPDGPSLSPKEA